MNAKPNAQIIAELTATLAALGTEYRTLRESESETMANVRGARKELRKFEMRAARCKTFKGRSNNEALAEYQRCVIRTGEARILELRDEFKHVASEITRFGDMIEEARQGLTRRNANCDGPCTDEKHCNACTELAELEYLFIAPVEALTVMGENEADYVVTHNADMVMGVGAFTGLKRHTLSEARAVFAAGERALKSGRIFRVSTLADVTHGH